MCWTWLSLNTSIVLLYTFMLAFSNRPPCCGTVQICFCPSSLQLLGPHFFFEVLFLPIGSISWHQILLLGEHKNKIFVKGWGARMVPTIVGWGCVSGQVMSPLFRYQEETFKKRYSDHLFRSSMIPHEVNKRTVKTPYSSLSLEDPSIKSIG